MSHLTSAPILERLSVSRALDTLCFTRGTQKAGHLAVGWLIPPRYTTDLYTIEMYSCVGGRDAVDFYGPRLVVVASDRDRDMLLIRHSLCGKCN